MIQCADGVLAVNLARQEDFEMLAAWLQDNLFLEFLERGGTEFGKAGQKTEQNAEQKTEQKEHIWNELKRCCLDRGTEELSARAADLGLAVSIARNGLQLPLNPSASAPPAPFTPTPALAPQIESQSRQSGTASFPTFQDLRNGDDSTHNLRFSSAPIFQGINFQGIKVLDISSLWAGPLAGKLFSMAGADVIKLESQSRPEAMKQFAPGFYEYLSGEKTRAALNLKTPEGKRELQEMIASSNIVIDNSRPRAMEQMGISPRDLVSEYGLIWISITGYGRDSNRVAFGDDAAAAGGLFLDKASSSHLPEFIGDAIADPLTGVEAFIAAGKCLLENKAGLLDISMMQTVKSYVS